MENQNENQLSLQAESDVEAPVKLVYDDFVIGNLTFEGEIVRREMEIRAEGGEYTVHAWLNKEAAQKLIEHLTKVFGLRESAPPQTKQETERPEKSEQEGESEDSKGGIMDLKRALIVVGRQRPCSHENVDERIGDGSTWVKCEDCGRTVEKARLGRSRESAEQFDEAMDIIEHSVNRAV